MINFPRAPGGSILDPADEIARSCLAELRAARKKR